VKIVRGDSSWVRFELREFIRTNHETQKSFAASAGVSGAFVSAVLKGKKEIPLAWLEKLGIHRVVETYYMRAEK
jgi:hypothetical protein